LPEANLRFDGAAILLVWVWPFILGSVLGWYKALAVRARIATPRDGDAGLGIVRSINSYSIFSCKDMS
jgi:hypothetical protein